MNPKIYVCADLHYDQKNIVKSISNWQEKDICRDFSSLKEMNEALIKSINDTVTKYDKLYFLGDIAFGGSKEIFRLMERINCKNTVLILGNHDFKIRDNKEVEVWNGGQLLYKETFGVVIPPNQSHTFKMQEFFSEVKERETLEYNGYKFILDHYPLSSWDGSYKQKSIMLHGHVHGKLDYSDANMYYRRMDVYWDRYKRPISLDEIIEIMKDRPALEI